jgi:hypothetical protein
MLCYVMVCSAMLGIEAVLLFVSPLTVRPQGRNPVQVLVEAVQVRQSSVVNLHRQPYSLLAVHCQCVLSSRQCGLLLSLLLFAVSVWFV